MTMLGLAEAMALYRVVLNELKGIPVEFDIEQLDAQIKVVLALVTSEKLTDSIANVFGRCAYNNEKLSMDTFEDVEMRSMYFEISKEVVVYNITPFLPKAILSYIEGLGVLGTQSQK